MNWLYWILLAIIVIIAFVLMVGCGSCLLVVQLIKRLFRVSTVKTTQSTNEDLKPKEKKRSLDLKEMKNFFELFKKRCSTTPDQIAYLWLDGEKGEELERMHFKDLYTICLGFAKSVIVEKYGLKKGEKVIILLPPGPSYNIAFFSCLSCGVIPITVYPPQRYAEDSDQLVKICKNSGAKYIISNDGIHYKTQALSYIVGNFKPSAFNWIALPEYSVLLKKFENQKVDDLNVEFDKNDVAFVQYTSGTETNPKGCGNTHGKLMTALRMSFSEFIPKDKSHFSICVFHPLYHDIGLFLPIAAGCTTIMFAPDDYLKNPLIWLKALKSYKPLYNITLPSMIDHMCQKVTKEEREEYKIPSTSAICVGGQEISASVMRKFSNLFNCRNVLCGYGLSECALSLSVASPELKVISVDRFDFLNKGIAKVIPNDSLDEKIEFVSLGKMMDSTKYAIVDIWNQTELPQNHVGELFVCDDLVIEKYVNNEELDKTTFNQRFVDLNGKETESRYLRTGDIFFVHENELYFCSRKADLIDIESKGSFPIIPRVLEKSVNHSHQFIKSSLSFTVDKFKGTEDTQLIIVAEIFDNMPKKSRAAVYDSINNDLKEEYGIVPARIVLVKEGSIPITRSFKKSRATCKNLFLRRKLKMIERKDNTELMGKIAMEKKMSFEGLDDLDELTMTAEGGKGLANFLFTKLDHMNEFDKKHTFIINFLRQRIGKVVDVDNIDVTKPLATYGLSSMMAIQLTNELSKSVGKKISATMLFNYPTVEKIALFLETQVFNLRQKTSNVIGEILGMGKKDEDIAVIGIGCHFSGDCNDVNKYWNLLKSGKSGVIEVPKERWDIDNFYDPNPEARGKMWTRKGGFINGVDQFDPTFFGISPREAESMDPQQRLLLQVSWNTFENAGLIPKKYFETKTGVYIAASSYDYTNIVTETKTKFPEKYDVDYRYVGTGCSGSVLAGRLSYVYGFQGPAITLDTACSSSLVTCHYASNALRNGECDLALAGGVNLTLDPKTYVAFTKTRMLSPDGTCKTFDDSANGYVRGEGIGLVLLKRYSDAVRDGDRIIGIMKSSCINQDGRSAGITAPNGLSQENVINTALIKAKLHPNDIDYVEAHGTGTSLGDPIEVESLVGVFGGKGRKTPLVVGSVKTNIGHTESAAGIAGALKILLSLKNETIPKHLNLKKLNHRMPHINSVPMYIPYLENHEWPRSSDRKRSAGISSFGFSGTNAHVIFQEAPFNEIEKEEEEEEEEEESIFCLSSRSKPSLHMLLEKYDEFLEEYFEDISSLKNLCFSQNITRTHFPENRIAISTSSLSDLHSTIKELAKNPEKKLGNVFKKKVESTIVPKVVFLFTGQGSQMHDMCRDLYNKEPTFKKWMNNCDEILKPLMGESILDVIFKNPEENKEKLKNTKYSQPALFAVEYSMAKVWEKFGILPDLLLGHSLGEVVAACFAKVMSLKDALQLIVSRGRYMSETVKGSMAAVFSEEEKVREVIETTKLDVSLAGLNGKNIVISGSTEDIDGIMEHFSKLGIRGKKLSVSHAFHSKMMEDILDPFEKDIRRINYSSPQIPIVSNLYGEVIDEDKVQYKFDHRYWRKHIRNPVQFSKGIESLVQNYGEDVVFVEVGPQSHLSSMTRRILGMDNEVPIYIESFKKGRNNFMNAICDVYASGLSFNWEEFYGLTQKIDIQKKGSKMEALVLEKPKYHRIKFDLPVYQFQKKSFWIYKGKSSVSFGEGNLHPLLGRKFVLPNQIVFQQVLPKDMFIGHKIFGNHILPSTAYLDMAISSVSQVFDELPPRSTFVVENIGFQEPIKFSGDDIVVQCVCKRASEKEFELEIFTVEKQENEREWKSHSSATISIGKEEEEEEEEEGEEEEEDITKIEKLKKKIDGKVDISEFYESIYNRGYHYGESFQNLKELYINEETNEGLGKVSLPEEFLLDEHYCLHPALSDSALHTLLGIMRGGFESDEELFLPISYKRVNFFSGFKGIKEAWVHVDNIEEMNKETASGNLTFFSDKGEVVCKIERFVGRKVSKDTLSKILGEETKLFYDMTWTETMEGEPIRKTDEEIRKMMSREDKESKGVILILNDAENQYGSKLKDLLERINLNVCLVDLGEEYKKIDDSHYVIKCSEKGNYLKFLKEVKDISKVVHMSSISTEEKINDDVMMRTCGSLMFLIQSLIESRFLPPLYVFTSGIFESNVFSSGVWGMARTISLELADMKCIRVNLPMKDEGDNLYLIAREIFLNHEKEKNFIENEIRYENEKRLVPKLMTSKQIESATEDLKFNPEKSYFITGGYGGLGLAIAENLAKNGVKKIVLVGRSKPKENAVKMVEKISKSCEVEISGAQGDVCDIEFLRESFKKHSPVGGVLHCAGVWRDAFILNQNWDDFLTVLKPKVLGSWNLHQVSLDHKKDVEHFIMFSSASSLFGSPGQTNYSAANGFIDSLAFYRSANGLPALTINWGSWGEIGLAAKSKVGTSKFGVLDMTPSEGIQAFDRLMKGEKNMTQIAVMKMNWIKFLNSNNLPVASLYTIIKDEVSWRPKVENSSSKEYDMLVKKLTSISDPKKRMRYMISKIQTIVANALKKEANEVDVRRPLMEMGMDSMIAMEISNTLQSTVGMKLSATILFDYPNIEKLAGFLMKKFVVSDVGESKKKKTKKASIPKAISSSINEPIAVIGLSCRFPAGDLDSNDEHAFWKMLVEGRNASTEIPADRFDLEEFYDKDGAEKKMYTRHGTFVNRPFEFDPKFFGMTGGEAITMDPQQRLLLEVSYEAMENACLKPFEMEGTKTGVFIGNMFMDYRDIVKDYGAVNYAGTGNHLSVMAGRVSYCFGFQGPVVTMDTACSSSLVSSHLACQSLRNRECNLAIAGGVNLLLNPYPYISECQMRMLSEVGLCQTFDDSADGYLRGEGCGIVVLKRLSDAKRDGDRILALIRGSSVNHDGKSAGLTAPNGESQERVIHQALDLANLSPKDISFIEAHGTGTPLGDPIELIALGNVFKGNKSPLLVGSVKTNIGHTEGNAGIGGIIKLILQLKHERIPKHLNIKKLNSHIPPFDELNLKITNPENPSDKSLEWKRDPTKKRIAGVSSFGFSGTNAHMIIEEAPEREEPKVVEEDLKSNKVLCISAKSLKSLKTTCLKYIEYIGDHCSKDVNLNDVCFTANTKKDNFAHRVSVYGKTSFDINKHLFQFVSQSENEGNEANQSLVYNNVGSADKKIVFFFTGQGSQHFGMAQDLYERNSVFRASMDECNEILKEYLESEYSILDIIFKKEHENLLNMTNFSQPAIFIVEYSMCQLWKSLGVEPDLMIGHSLGEVVAACFSGVMSLKDGLRLIVLRSKYMVSTESGSMAAVFTQEEKVVEMIKKNNMESKVFIAGLNGQTNTVISGTNEDIDEFLSKLKEEQIKFRKLVVSNAFHSKLMDPILEPFFEGIKDITFNKPQIPIVSNLYKGEIIDDISKIAMNASYWKEHIRNPVQFLRGIETLVEKEGTNLICLEVGPTPHLSSMTRRILSDPKKYAHVQYIHSFTKGVNSYDAFTHCLCEFFCCGIPFDWTKVFKQFNEKIPSIVYEPALPYYSFDNEEYNVVPYRDQIYRKSLNYNGWDEKPLGKGKSGIKGTILVFVGEEPTKDGFSKKFVELLKSKNVPLAVVQFLDSMEAGTSSLDEASGVMSVSSSFTKEDFIKLLGHEVFKKLPKLTNIVNLSSLKFLGEESALESCKDSEKDSKYIENSIQFSCMTNINLIQVCSRMGIFPQILTATQNVYTYKSMFLDKEEEEEEEEEEKTVSILQSYIWGLAKCINHESPAFGFKLVDLDDHSSPESLLEEVSCQATDPEKCVSLLNDKRYVLRLKELEIKKTRKFSTFELDKNGTFLITGGCSGLGFGFCEYLVKQKGVKNVVLVGRSGVRSEKVKEEIERLQRLFGCSINVEKGDVSNNESVFNVLSSVKEKYPKLNGVIHCAGIFDNCLVANQTKERFLRLHLPKVYGTLFLHKNLKKLNMRPKHFILFSSIVSIFGTPGNASYCSSNSFLDSFCFYRPLSKAINWGLWGDIGGATTAETFDRDQAAELLKYEGQGLLTKRTGFQLFEQMHGFYDDYPQICAAIIHWNNLRRFKFGGTDLPMIEDIDVRKIGEGISFGESGKSSGGRKGDDDDEEEEGEPLSPLMLEFMKNEKEGKIKDEEKLKEVETSFIQNAIVKMVEDLLSEDFEEDENKKLSIDIHRDLVDYGVNSIHGLTLRNQLSKWVGIVLPIDMAFTNPHIYAISHFIYGQKDAIMNKAEMITSKKAEKKSKKESAKGGESDGEEEGLPEDFSFVGTMKMMIRKYVRVLITKVHEGKSFGDNEHLYEIEANIVKTNIVRNHINEEFKIDIPVEEFFKGPTILKLCNLIIMNLFPEKFQESDLFKIEKVESQKLPASLGYIFDTNWLQCIHPRPNAKLRLFMTPPAGMNTSFYRETLRFFPEEVEVVVVHLPGRTSRLTEPIFNNMMILAKVCVKEIAHVLKDKPYAFFGHCMGGQINYELYCEIRRQNLPEPKHFFVFSSHAPHIANGLFPQVEWNDDQIVEFIKNTNGGVLPKALENKTMNKLVLGIMRSDLNKVGSQEIKIQEDGSIYHAYLKEEIPKLDVDVTGWGGGKDDFVLEQYLRDWGELVNGKMTLEMFPEEDHYAYVDAVGVMKPDGERILGLVVKEVMKVVEKLEEE